MSALKNNDPTMYKLLNNEHRRIEEEINLIPSENYTPFWVFEAVGSVATTKYAEGYPGRRYYAGCEYMDNIENLARTRFSELFNLNDTYHINVQPHSGANANLAVYYAFLEKGDTVLGMDLNAGGHLTHGFKRNFSGRDYNAVQYNIDPKTECIDLEEVRRLAHEHKPKMIIAGASAYPRHIDFAGFKKIADEVGAFFWVDMAHIAGLVATGLHPSPFPHADIVTTTTHKTLRGTRGGVIAVRPEWNRKIDSAVMPGVQGGPLMHAIAGKAVGFEYALRPEFKTYQQEVINHAQTMAAAFKKAGIRVTTDGTDNHLMVLDLTDLGIGGKEGEEFLAANGIYTNRNTIPNDPRGPLDPSGIRLGTPALVARGFTTKEALATAELIIQTLKNPSDSAQNLKIKKAVSQMCKQYPVYPELTKQEQEELIIPAQRETELR